MLTNGLPKFGLSDLPKVTGSIEGRHTNGASRGIYAGRICLRDSSLHLPVYEVQLAINPVGVEKVTRWAAEIQQKHVRRSHSLLDFDGRRLADHDGVPIPRGGMLPVGKVFCGETFSTPTRFTNDHGVGRDPGCCTYHPKRGRASQTRPFPNPRTYSATSVLRFFVTCACASNQTRHSVLSSSTNHAVSLWDDVLKWRAASKACTSSFFM